MTDASTTLARDLLRDGFGRIREGVPLVVEGLSVEQLLWRPDADANHIAWLLWHLSRQQDEQVAHLAGRRSAYLEDGWAERFDLPYAASAHGWGQSSAEVGAFRMGDPGLLGGYQGAVHERTIAYVDATEADEWAGVIDKRWDPPVTVAVRVVSVLGDAMKHLGQAEYVKGLVTRRA
ncbi:chorismate synthase [Intrasporangium oryzae NRRL B-24470]|uniref:Chorismate synthase n=1 Tax=Intrasporangium oryzae NRRL B-24470 TaxID=1386089 RepID=W9G8Y9_9MICO|nr:DinB family protein [Intrasporangium oryzae]EWT01298.1 chorismate synthase [Intrasporangium oryzae NRRL B-24470]